MGRIGSRPLVTITYTLLMAKLYFRYSAMNSGKSTALLQTAFNYEERGMQVLILKPAIDHKGNKAIVSRVGLSRDADILIFDSDDVAIVLKSRPDIACVLVDEAQFITPAQAEQLFWFAALGDIPVIAYGLRTDFATCGFPGATRLLELAHELSELKTICRCGRKAVLNGRKMNGTFIFEGEQVAIDNQNHIEYESLCAGCYNRFKTEAAL